MLQGTCQTQQGHNCTDQSHLSAARSATGNAFSAVAIAVGSQNQAIRSFLSLARTRESSMNITVRINECLLVMNRTKSKQANMITFIVI
jgi:hypothetical protein